MRIENEVQATNNWQQTPSNEQPVISNEQPLTNVMEKYFNPERSAWKEILRRPTQAFDDLE
ncbi:MAG: hypothetical protein AB3N16_08755, partial [Flavobacteriaceae bacterium]